MQTRVRDSEAAGAAASLVLWS